MILITGGRGFLGSALVEGMKRIYRTARDGGGAYPAAFWRYALFDVPAHTIIWPDPWNLMASKNSEGRGLDDLDNWVKRADVVVHAAAMANLNDVSADPEKGRRINVEGTRNVAEACKRNDRFLIYISTCCVYGEAGYGAEPATEKTEPKPTEEYARQKLEGEKEIERIMGPVMRLPVDGPAWAVARLGTFYGPGMRDALFNAKALRAAKNQGHLDIHGSGLATRRYVYIDDVVEALLTMIHDRPAMGIYNICGDAEISVMDTISVAERVSGTRIAWCENRDRNGQIQRQNISNATAVTHLGWRPHVSYEEGMRRAWEWMNAS